MNRRIDVEISESVEELKRLHKQQPDKRLAQRIHFLLLLKTGQLKRLSQGPDLLNQHRHTLRRWLLRYTQGGLEALLTDETPPGRPSGISSELEAQFEKVLTTTGFAGGYREAHAFAQEQGCTLSYHAVRTFLRNRFGTKPKVARPKHAKQDPEALEAFKKKDLPTPSKRLLRANLAMTKSSSISKTKRDSVG